MDKKFNLENVHLFRSNKSVSIEISCPNKFDENDLACFWCNFSDQCRKECELENEAIQNQI